MKNLKIALGGDHAGFLVKKELLTFLTSQGHKVIDCGAHDEEASDYPDYACRVAQAVATKRCDRGILVCGTGTGMAMAANKIKGIRAAVCWSPKIAELASQHNWANVLCLPSRIVSTPNLKKITKAWLKTPFEKGGRHERRVKKIMKMEGKSFVGVSSL